MTGKRKLGLALAMILGVGARVAYNSLRLAGPSLPEQVPAATASIAPDSVPVASVVVPKVLRQVDQDHRRRVQESASRLLDQPDALPPNDFLLALQIVERTDPRRAHRLLQDRVRSAPRDEDRKFLLGFPARFTHAGSHRRFSLWALRETSLELDLAELQLMSSLYFTEPYDKDQVLRDWGRALRKQKDPGARAYLSRKILDRLPAERDEVAAQLESLAGVDAEELLRIPSAGQPAKTEGGRED